MAGNAWSAFHYNPVKMALVATVGTYYAMDNEDGDGDAAAEEEVADSGSSKTLSYMACSRVVLDFTLLCHCSHNISW